MDGLDDRCVVVTGATGLIGGAIARRLAAEGATVVVTSRQHEDADVWIDEHGTEEMVPLELDLAAEASIETAVETLGESSLAPAALVANASARDALAGFNEAGHDEFERLFGIDVAGHFLLARSLVETSGEFTSVVFTSSVYAAVGVDRSIYPDGMAPTPPQYAAAKAGMNGLVRYLAARWGSRGVRVNAVVAGGVEAPDRQSSTFATNYAERTMLGRLAAPEEIASPVCFLAAADSSYLTGECLTVDGGLSKW